MLRRPFFLRGSARDPNPFGRLSHYPRQATTSLLPSSMGCDYPHLVPHLMGLS